MDEQGLKSSCHETVIAELRVPRNRSESGGGLVAAEPPGDGPRSGRDRQNRQGVRMIEAFDEFMSRREAAARAYCTGDPAPLMEVSASDGQATFFDPGGGFTEGAAAVNRTNSDGAAMFGADGQTHFEVHDSGSSGDLGFWTGFQIAEVAFQGKPGNTPMKLRVTEIFRRDAHGWKMIHRHASIAKT